MCKGFASNRFTMTFFSATSRGLLVSVTCLHGLCCCCCFNAFLTIWARDADNFDFSDSTFSPPMISFKFDLFSDEVPSKTDSNSASVFCVSPPIFSAILCVIVLEVREALANFLKIPELITYFRSVASSTAFFLSSLNFCRMFFGETMFAAWVDVAVIFSSKKFSLFKASFDFFLAASSFFFRSSSLESSSLYQRMLTTLRRVDGIILKYLCCWMNFLPTIN